MKHQTDLFNQVATPDTPAFYNTIAAGKEDLRQHVKVAATQEENVLSLFKERPRMTALEVADKLQLHESSARRCVTNLFHKGLLIKTGEQKIERYGKKNYYFQLK